MFMFFPVYILKFSILYIERIKLILKNILNYQVISSMHGRFVEFFTTHRDQISWITSPKTSDLLTCFKTLKSANADSKDIAMKYILCNL